MEVDGETLNGIFSGVKRERLKEMGSFLFYCGTASARPRLALGLILSGPSRN